MLLFGKGNDLDDHKKKKHLKRGHTNKYKWIKNKCSKNGAQLRAIRLQMRFGMPPAA